MRYSLKKRSKALIFVFCSVVIFTAAVLLMPSFSYLPISFAVAKPVNTVPPTITLMGEKLTILEYGEVYTEEGYTATDDIEGDITDEVEVSTIDYTPGTNIITYTAKDSSGNIATAERHIFVKSEHSRESVPTKSVFLTFDDGPCKYTEEILDILAKYNVKATFFVTGQMPDYSYVMKRIVDEGHTIAVHTYSHSYNIYSSSDAFFADLNKINDLIYKETGRYSVITRFPGGSSNKISKKYKEGIMSELSVKLTDKGYIYYDWNVDSGDTSTTKPEKIVKNVTSSLKEGHSIVLLHDLKSANITALPQIIEYCQKNGYTLLPMSDKTPIVRHSINN